MGYEVDTEKLASIEGQLRSGANALEQVARALPEAIDAGFSSDVANAALARVGKAALALTGQGETMAANIDAAKGAYLASEHQAQDDVHLAEKDIEDREHRQQGSLQQAEPEPGAQQNKNHPAPTPAPPGPTPTPPAPTSTPPIPSN